MKEIPLREIVYISNSQGMPVQLGQGGFGTVFKAKWGEKYVAVKYFKDKGDHKSFDRECDLLSEVDHENVIKLYGVCRESSNPVLVIEYIEDGSLDDIIHKKEINYTVADAIDWMRQCAKGVAYLHSMRPKLVIHRDLKPSNLLLNQNKRHLKICDMCLTREKSEKMTSWAGTARYMAPEVIEGGKYTEKCDVYSFSIILWEVFARERPHKNLTMSESVMFSVFNGRRPSAVLSENWPEGVQKLIIQCWNKSHTKRPSMQYVLDEMGKIFEPYEST